MRTRKNYKRKSYSSRKSRNGGFFSQTKKTLPECNINNLSSLSKDTGDGQNPLIKMRNNYQSCCPKNFMGKKNTSPYCKQLDANFKALSNYQRDIEGYYGEETNVAKIKEEMNSPTIAPLPAPTTVPIPAPTYEKKPWYKFWGGKKHRKSHRHKRRTNKRK